MRELHIYIDETGNTGNNLFDKNQRFFINGVLICDGDFNEKYGRFIKKLAERVNVQELHGNELGLGRIELIAEDVTRILAEEDIDLFFSIIDKVFLGKLKFFDIFFDSGINPKMLSHRYSIRILRLILAFKVTSLLDLENTKKFWKSFKKKDEETLKQVIDFVIEKSRQYLDRKSNEIVCECLSWARENLNEFENVLPDNYDVPNTASMSLLISFLNYRYKDEKVKITEFVHDDQEQFRGYLKEVFDYIHLALPNYEPLSILPEIIDKGVYKCNFKMDDSSRNFALQFVDVLLWFTKKTVFDKKAIDDYNLELFNLIIHKAGITHITQEQYENELTSDLLEIMSRPIDEENLIEAEEQIKKWEEEHYCSFMNKLP